MRSLESQPATIFDDLHHLLAGTSIAPSELHGVLCGLVCIDRHQSARYGVDAFLNYLYSKARSCFQQKEVILDLYDSIGRQLSGVEGQFELLLPNDPATLADQLESFIVWCRGFLYGLSYVSEADLVDEDIPNIIGKIVQCIAEMTKYCMPERGYNDLIGLAYRAAQAFMTNLVSVLYHQFSGINQTVN
jgi:uncharacterized protein